MTLLETEHPTWVCVGCAAHGVHLAMKDFCKHSFSRGRTAMEWGIKWLADVNKDANTIANYLNDSSAAKYLLRGYQKAVYGAHKQITVSVPTRFATNLFVMQSLQSSKAALLQAIGDLKWDDFDGKATEVRQAMSSPMFWTLLADAITFLAPFSDFIHQIEADRPSLARCYDGLDQLDKHVRACVQQWQGVDCLEGSCSSVLRTWERRLEHKHGTSVVPLLSAAHTAAYLLDPLYAKVDGKQVMAPDVPFHREEGARDLIERIGGEAARDEFVATVGGGWSGIMAETAKGCAATLQQAQGAGADAGHKSALPEVAGVRRRKGVWKRYGRQTYPALSDAAIRLLCVHGTSCTTERNWALWGRVYASSRNALGMERAKKLIAFCFNNRAEVPKTDDSGLLLSVVQGSAAD
jgi:hypothetical protein